MNQEEPFIKRGLVVGYDRKPILVNQDDVHLFRGETTILVGNNGSGKSTLLKTICGQIVPILGSMCKTQTVYLPEELEFEGFMTAKEILHASFWNPMPYVEASITLGVPLKTPFEHMSKGNRQKLRVVYAEGFAYLLNADVLCLDEPLSGMDTMSRRLLTDMWSRKRPAPKIFSEAHRIITMHSGDAPENIQTIVAAGGKATKLPSIANCDRWYDLAIENGVILEQK